MATKFVVYYEASDAPSPTFRVTSNQQILFALASTLAIELCLFLSSIISSLLTDN
jgi:hypothetical protein